MYHEEITNQKFSGFDHVILQLVKFKFTTLEMINGPLSLFIQKALNGPFPSLAHVFENEKLKNHFLL